MIETECFDDLNIFYNPDGSLVANLNEQMPPLDEVPPRPSCCFQFFSSPASPRLKSSSKFSAHQKATINHNNAAGATADASTNESALSGPPPTASPVTSTSGVLIADHLEGLAPSLDPSILAADDSGSTLLDLAVLRSQVLLNSKFGYHKSGEVDKVSVSSVF